MLFNSYVFLFGFLPIALAGYEIAGRFDRRWVIAWLALISLAFYAYWKPPLVLLLVSSVLVNYLVAVLISREPAGSRRGRAWMWAAIAANLALLGYFKYLFPVLNFVSHAAGLTFHWSDLVLPLGISFFTFTQIAYLVDLQQGIASLQSLPSYTLFVTFFPHLIAGPILHHKEIMPQFTQDRVYRLRLDDLAVGLTWFVMGMGKKVLLADHFSHQANAVFDMTGALPAATAWSGVLAYSLQLYFDFSGYSDMAIGLARMFSIDFPLNFSSPYKARNIADFWQRWHITLTHYITAFVYSPLQLWIFRRREEKGKKISRKAFATPGGFASMVAFPMLTTMFIAGIWHGAGTQYLVFGLLHGTYLIVNHGWATFRPKRNDQRAHRAILDPCLQASCVLLTFLCVLIAQVFFRAKGTGQAVSLLADMAGLHGLRAAQDTGTDLASRFALLAGFFIVWALPNTQQILKRFKPALRLTPWDAAQAIPRALVWTPNAAWGALVGGLFIVALVRLRDPSTFLYFQF
jgi:alginate O-acetyltransferase complex protein AlgI